MKIITLREEDFNDFAKNHKYKNPFQTSSYGKVMTTEGYNYHFLGFLNNSNELIGASMLLYKPVYWGYKIALAPYGFLIDYTNNDLIEELTLRLRKLLFKQKFLFIKINPLIHCTERNNEGQMISYNPEINDILEILQKNGYIHHGFNRFFENNKPRWTAITKLLTSNDKLYYLLSKNVRNKINKANNCGIEIHKGTMEDLPILYEFIKRKQRKSLKYYHSILENYNGDAEIYLAHINPSKYIKNCQTLYEKEYARNEELNELLQKKSTTGKNITKLINKKMESDKMLGVHHENLATASLLFQNHPEGITIGGCLIIRYDKGIHLIIEGFDKEYRSYNSNYLLKWELIKKFNNEGYSFFNLNGITGEFNEKNKYSGLNEMKLGYNASAIEYIGEFDLIINKTVYNMYKKKTNKK
ncbi:MAG: aminoacyltransferase [Bacilli bacterium]|nr:aminoacyltransferase [Bacilli bacterium]